MKGNRGAFLFAERIQFRDVLNRVKHRRQPVLDHRDTPDRQEVGHHENARIDAGKAKRYTFFDVAHGEPRGAVLDEHARYFDGSVTVSVRLYDGHDGDRFTDRPGYRAVVGCDL
jgi:hypothetical protein